MPIAPSGSYWLETNLILWICGQFQQRMLLSLLRIKACSSLRHPRLVVTMWILPFSGCSKKFTAPFLRRNWNAAMAKLMARRCLRVPRLMLSLGLIWKSVRWRNYLLVLVDFSFYYFKKQTPYIIIIIIIIEWGPVYIYFLCALIMVFDFLFCDAFFMIGSMR